MSQSDQPKPFLSNSENALFSTRGYSFGHQIGEGAYAKVFDSNLKLTTKYDGHLACKVIDTKMAPREFSAKFLPREIDILGKIGHPNIVHVFSIYRLKSIFFIFMRYAELGDLLDYVLVNGELSEKLCKFWFHQLASAIYYLHNLNIAHRDIKCENILISNHYNIKLADFGFARYVADANGKHILSSTFCGSLAYASPEILRGKSYYPKGSDIWSIGIVLYIMLNKSMPFHDKNAKILYKQQMGRKWRFRTKVEQIISKEVINLVSDLLEPDFRRRIQASNVINNDWFTSEGFVLTEECRHALENASKFRTEMVSKNQSKLFRGWEKEADFVVVFPEKEPIESSSTVQLDVLQIKVTSTTKNITPAPEPEITDNEIDRIQSNMAIDISQRNLSN